MSDQQDHVAKEHGWLKQSSNVSLEEVNNTVSVPSKGGFWRKLLAFVGPGSLVAVGYVDPGNWQLPSQEGHVLVILC